MWIKQYYVLYTVPGTVKVTPVMSKYNIILSQTVDTLVTMLPNTTCKISFSKFWNQNPCGMVQASQPASEWLPAHFLCHVHILFCNLYWPHILDSPLPWERVAWKYIWYLHFIISKKEREQQKTNRKLYVMVKKHCSDMTMIMSAAGPLKGHQPSGTKGLFLWAKTASSSILHLIF